ncbi:hypothetical protein D3C81_925390 [compost metagenome]
MRSGTELIALGMTRCGSRASPAVMPIISTPPKANITTVNEAIMPPTPLGKKPPWLHRLLMLASCSPEPPSWMPNISTAAPARIIDTIAVTFSSDNQNSSSPNTLTLHRFRAPMKNTMPNTQIQRGVSGNQKLMYTPKAVTSARHTTSIEKA